MKIKMLLIVIACMFICGCGHKTEPTNNIATETILTETILTETILTETILEEERLGEPDLTGIGEYKPITGSSLYSEP